MIILGIESSCDDTSVALLDITDKKIEILAEKTASQIEVHKKYGGVVPEIAGRLHAEKIIPLIEAVHELTQINKSRTFLRGIRPRRKDSFDTHSSPQQATGYSGKVRDKPDVIAVTSGPGLITGLLVGVEVAKTLSYLWNIPIVNVNHIEGHIYSPFINNDTIFPLPTSHFPLLALIASGGHSEIILSTEEGKYERVGGTKDDAAGECFDKVAKLLGFDYPGGPKISKFAETGNPQAIKFPRPMLDSDNFDFSFSGLKTSALYWLRDNVPIVIPTVTNEERVSEAEGSLSITPTNLKLKAKAKPKAKGSLSAQGAVPAGRQGSAFGGGFARDDIDAHDFCASFEQAIIDVLVGKTLKAVKKYQPKTVILAGGVSANKKLRETLKKEVTPYSLFLTPSIKYAMDNATMIAVAAYSHAKKKEFTQHHFFSSKKSSAGFTNWKDLQANPNWKIYE